MDRCRTLQGGTDMRRRASHAGFEAEPVIDPSSLRQRRKSLPATFFKKEDESRKLHNSSACINLIEDLNSVKLVAKHKSPLSPKGKHNLDPFLQEHVRKTRKPSIIPPTYKPGTHTFHHKEDIEPKRSSSFEVLSEREDDALSLSARRTSSDSSLADLDVENPDDLYVSDEELQIGA